MAQTTTNYGLYKPEATDTYNHLVYDNPNMDTIDAAMKDNSNHGVDNATCIKSGTVHSVTRTNTSCPVFKFTATGDWNTGDTMDVDGTPVSVFLPNGTAPLTGCYVINTEVMAIISGTRVTLLCPVMQDASTVAFDPTGTTLASTNVEGALQELNDASNVVYASGISVKGMLDLSSNNFTAGPGVTIGSKNIWYKEGRFAYISLVLSITSNLNAGDVLATANGVSFVNLNYVLAKRDSDNTGVVLTTNGGSLVTDFAISAGTVLRIGAVVPTIL